DHSLERILNVETAFPPARDADHRARGHRCSAGADQTQSTGTEPERGFLRGALHETGADRNSAAGQLLAGRRVPAAEQFAGQKPVYLHGTEYLDSANGR